MAPLSSLPLPSSPPSGPLSLPLPYSISLSTLSTMILFLAPRLFSILVLSLSPSHLSLLSSLRQLTHSLFFPLFPTLSLYYASLSSLSFLNLISLSSFLSPFPLQVAPHSLYYASLYIPSPFLILSPSLSLILTPHLSSLFRCSPLYYAFFFPLSLPSFFSILSPSFNPSLYLPSLRSLEYLTLPPSLSMLGWSFCSLRSPYLRSDSPNRFARHYEAYSCFCQKLCYPYL